MKARKVTIALLLLSLLPSAASADEVCRHPTASQVAASRVFVLRDSMLRPLVEECRNHCCHRDTNGVLESACRAETLPDHKIPEEFCLTGQCAPQVEYCGDDSGANPLVMLGRCFGQGMLWDAILHPILELVRHPIDTFQGIVSALGQGGEGLADAAYAMLHGGLPALKHWFIENIGRPIQQAANEYIQQNLQEARCMNDQGKARLTCNLIAQAAMTFVGATELRAAIRGAGGIRAAARLAVRRVGSSFRNVAAGLGTRAGLAETAARVAQAGNRSREIMAALRAATPPQVAQTARAAPRVIREVGRELVRSAREDALGSGTERVVREYAEREAARDATRSVARAPGTPAPNPQVVRDRIRLLDEQLQYVRQRLFASTMRARPLERTLLEPLAGVRLTAEQISRIPSEVLESARRIHDFLNEPSNFSRSFAALMEDYQLVENQARRALPRLRDQLARLREMPVPNDPGERSTYYLRLGRLAEIVTRLDEGRPSRDLLNAAIVRRAQAASVPGAGGRRAIAIGRIESATAFEEFIQQALAPSGAPGSPAGRAHPWFRDIGFRGERHGEFNHLLQMTALREAELAGRIPRGSLQQVLEYVRNTPDRMTAEGVWGHLFDAFDQSTFRSPEEVGVVFFRALRVSP